MSSENCNADIGESRDNSPAADAQPVPFRIDDLLWTQIPKSLSGSLTVWLAYDPNESESKCKTVRSGIISTDEAVDLALAQAKTTRGVGAVCVSDGNGWPLLCIPMLPPLPRVGKTKSQFANSEE